MASESEYSSELDILETVERMLQEFVHICIDASDLGDESESETTPDDESKTESDESETKSDADDESFDAVAEAILNLWDLIRTMYNNKKADQNQEANNEQADCNQEEDNDQTDRNREADNEQQDCKREADNEQKDRNREADNEKKDRNQEVDNEQTDRNREADNEKKDRNPEADISKSLTLIIKSVLEWFTGIQKADQEEQENSNSGDRRQDAEEADSSERNSKYDFTAIAVSLLEVFIRVSGNETGKTTDGTEKDKTGGCYTEGEKDKTGGCNTEGKKDKTCGCKTEGEKDKTGGCYTEGEKGKTGGCYTDSEQFWGDFLVDLCFQLLHDFTDSFQSKEGNCNDQKNINTDWKYIAKELVADFVEVWLWVCSGCQEVAADSYKANGVILSCDKSSYISDFISDCSWVLHNWDETALVDYERLAIKTMFVLIRILLKLFNLLLGTYPLRQPVSNFKDTLTYRCIHWLNDNSCEFTRSLNTEWTEESLICTIDRWVKAMGWSSCDHDEQCEQCGQCHDLILATCNIVIKLNMCMVMVLGPIVSVNDDFDGVFNKALSAVGKIFPYYEHCLRRLTCIILFRVLRINSKISFAEKTGILGKRFVKDVSILELLCFMCEYQQPTPSEFMELQEIVKQLSRDFEIENVRRRVPEGVDSKQQVDGAQTHAVNADDESVVLKLWSVYEDTLLQTNWCSAYSEVTHIITLVIDDLAKFYFPEHSENSETIQHIKGACASLLSGSRLDGCVSLLSGPGNACDLDIMVPLFRSDNHIMESVPDRPVNVLFKHKCFEGNPYLSPLNYKNCFFMSPIIFFCLSVLESCPFNRRLNTAQSFQYGDVACTYLLFQDEHVIFSIDSVLAMVINSWPDQAQSWIERKTDWPSLEMKKNIASSGCHAVPKTPKDGNPHRDWRLSFSKAENTLCKILTPTQLFHLSLLKTQFQTVKSKICISEVRIFKHYTISEGVFHTYHAKTAMFWFCENHPPTHDIWREENVFRCQSKLLESMEGMMRKGRIPHYFIPQQNLLEGIPAELLQQAAGELCVLKEDALTESGRVYQQIINQSHDEDGWSQFMSEFKKLYKHLYNNLT